MTSPRILLLEPDSSAAKSIKSFLEQRELSVDLSTTTTEAIELCNKKSYDAVVCELALHGHSGTEFLYEFRSYPEWQNIPCIVYSKLPLSKNILNSRGWKALNLSAYRYKPNCKLTELFTLIQDVTGQYSSNTPPLLESSLLDSSVTSSCSDSFRRDSEASFSGEGVPVGTSKAETELVDSFDGTGTTGILLESSKS